MPLGTLDRTPPPFFKQGPSALSKLMVFSAVALFLMVADTRFKLAQPLRAGVATVLYPLQWLALRPVLAVRYTGEYFESLRRAQAAEEEARSKLATQSQRANQVDSAPSVCASVPRIPPCGKGAGAANCSSLIPSAARRMRAVAQ